MVNPLYQKYSITDFDKFDCIKLSKGLYLLLMYLLRAYAVWLMSVTNMQDRVATIAWVYPERSMFYLGLFSGAIGLFFTLILSLRRPGAPLWVKYCWLRARGEIFALLFDWLVVLCAFQYWQMASILTFSIQTLLSAAFIVFCLINSHFAINIQEFPEKLPEK